MITHHNLNSDLKFTYVGLVHLDRNGKTIKTPIVVCDELFDDEQQPVDDNPEATFNKYVKELEQENNKVEVPIIIEQNQHPYKDEKVGELVNGLKNNHNKRNPLMDKLKSLKSKIGGN